MDAAHAFRRRKQRLAARRLARDDVRCGRTPARGRRRRRLRSTFADARDRRVDLVERRHSGQRAAQRGVRSGRERGSLGQPGHRHDAPGHARQPAVGEPPHRRRRRRRDRRAVPRGAEPVDRLLELPEPRELPAPHAGREQRVARHPVPGSDDHERAGVLGAVRHAGRDQPGHGRATALRRREQRLRIARPWRYARGDSLRDRGRRHPHERERRRQPRLRCDRQSRHRVRRRLPRRPSCGGLSVPHRGTERRDRHLPAHDCRQRARAVVHRTRGLDDPRHRARSRRSERMRSRAKRRPARSRRACCAPTIPAVPGTT